MSPPDFLPTSMPMETAMTDLTPLFPRQPVPPLEVRLLGGGSWRLAGQRPANFTMIVFYRGWHCPICWRYLADLDRRLDKFAERGVGVIAISSDTEDRARASKADWQLERLELGYGLDLDVGRRWGLYISTGVGVNGAGLHEPELFTEPALYLVRADGTLYWGSVQTMPFARPSFAEVVQALDVVLGQNYPARGEVLDHRARLSA